MFDEDLTAFFKTDEHAVAATYDGGATPINGIFNEPDLGQLGMIAGSNPTFLCAASDVDADPTGNTLVIGAVTYTIRDIRPQDDGAVVILELSAP
jgi:hypothetical protein